MSKAIIFDCFGVLVGEGWKAFLQLHFGDSGERHDWAVEQMQRVSRGEQSHTELADIMNKKIGVSQQEFLSMLHTNPVNLALFEYIQQLKHQYKIGFLSNVGMNRLEELFTPHQIALFDAMVLSYEIKAAKPDVEAYEYTARQLGVMPENCLMVDDTAAYCEGAERVGMKSLLTLTFPRLKRKSWAYYDCDM